VEEKITKCRTEDEKMRMKALHRLLYGRPGTATDFRKNLRNFNGFAFSVGSDEFKSKVDHLIK
jgi:protein DEK